MIIIDNKYSKGGVDLPGRIPNLREDLILAGIQEINSHGIAGFSIRRVAEACKVSCAAPYRHFKDKNDLIGAIIDYVNEQWAKRQDEVLARCGPSHREQMVEICVNYVRFLMEKPFYRAVLMLKDDGFNNLYHKKRTQFGSLSQTLENLIFQNSGMSADTWNRKLLIFRSIMFGAVFLFDAGEFEFCEEALEHIRYTLDREFDVL